MDLVKLMDKTMRHGQIGSLGSKMEKFRDLKAILGKDLGTTMGSFEDKVIEYHKQFAKRSINVWEYAGMSQEE